MTGESDRPSLWIVHREPRARMALARLAGAEDALQGAPGDQLFDSAAAPSVVVLGLGGDFERELEFVHRMLPRLGDAAWILSPTSADRREVERLFEGIAAELIVYPPDARELRAAVGRSLHRRHAQPLSRRRSRDLLTARFSHWFGDLEIPGLMRALDPGLASLPLLVRGETGTGRGLLARYVNSFGGDGSKRFVHVACRGAQHEADLVEQLAGAAAGTSATGTTIWLDEVDLLPSWLQRHVKDWVEFGLPESAASLEPVRWMASAGDDLEWGSERLERQLAELLSAHSLRAPSMRERPEAIARFAQEAARKWKRTSGLASRSFSDDAIDALSQHPWPGNLRELEAVIVRSLSSSSADPLTAAQLRFEADEPESSLPPTHADAASPPTHRAPVDEASPPTHRAADKASPPTHGEAMDEASHSDSRRGEAPAPRAPVAPPRARLRKPVDIAAILDSTLDDLRDRIQSRRLLVLKELDRDAPFVLGDAEQLRGALAGLLELALANVPERGDMYLASSRHAGGQPNLRVLLRYRRPDPDAEPHELEPFAAPVEETESPELARAEQVVRDHGGSLTVDATDRRERLIVVDLPAAPDP